MRCNISNPTMRTGLDFKSSASHQTRSNCADLKSSPVLIVGFEILHKDSKLSMYIWKNYSGFVPISNFLSHLVCTIKYLSVLFGIGSLTSLNILFPSVPINRLLYKTMLNFQIYVYYRSYFCSNVSENYGKS